MKKLLAAVSIALLTHNSFADTVFDTFGPGNRYLPTGGLTVSGPDSTAFPLPPHNAEKAAKFTSLVSGNLATVDLALQVTSAVGSVNVYLFADAPPGPGDFESSPDYQHQTLLGSVTSMVPMGTSSNAIVTVVVSQTVAVVAGQTYWLVLKAGDPITGNTWNYAVPFVQGRVMGSVNDTTWVGAGTMMPAFRITTVSSAVPELASSLWLLTIAIVGLAFARRQVGLKS